MKRHCQARLWKRLCKNYLHAQLNVLRRRDSFLDCHSVIRSHQLGTAAFCTASHNNHSISQPQVWQRAARREPVVAQFSGSVCSKCRFLLSEMLQIDGKYGYCVLHSGSRGEKVWHDIDLIAPLLMAYVCRENKQRNEHGCLVWCSAVQPCLLQLLLLCRTAKTNVLSQKIFIGLIIFRGHICYWTSRYVSE